MQAVISVEALSRLDGEGRTLRELYDRVALRRDNYGVAVLPITLEMGDQSSAAAASPGKPASEAQDGCSESR
jgi:hypothetical protein